MFLQDGLVNNSDTWDQDNVENSEAVFMRQFVLKRSPAWSSAKRIVSPGRVLATLDYFYVQNLFMCPSNCLLQHAKRQRTLCGTERAALEWPHLQAATAEQQTQLLPRRRNANGTIGWKCATKSLCLQAWKRYLATAMSFCRSHATAAKKRPRDRINKSV